MRMRLVVAFIFLFFVLLLSRVYYLSIKSNVYYEELARQNSIKTDYLAPTRGEILDRNGSILAMNDLGFSIALKPYLSIKKEHMGKLEMEVAKLQEHFPDLNATMLIRNYKRSDSYYNQDFIELVDFLTYDEISPHFSQLSQNENIRIIPTTKRKYPYGKLASHIIGYTQKANLQDMSENEIAKLTNYTGKSGIERYYNEILQGERGERVYKVNAFNQVLEELSYKDSSSQNIVLSLDVNLQSYLSEIFADNSGAAVVMDAYSGEILAASSFPEYDLNPFVRGISTKDWKALIENLDHPFTNRLVNANYPPGSVVKMGVGLAFLNSNSINTATEFYCSGSVELAGRNFRCWNRSGHGGMDLKHAIKHSCDVYFYEGSLKVGIDLIASTLSRIGFGAKTGVDLPNEFVGVVPSKEWKMQRYKKPWYQGETLNTSIGQGNFLVTPMQIAKYTAQIATGEKVSPHFLKDKNLSSPKEIFTLFEKAQLPYIRNAMYAVANEQGGTAYRYLNHLPVKIAAKTGTAQVIGFSQADKNRVNEAELKYYTRSHTWITSYAPYDKPRYVVTILLEHGGKSTTTGALTAQIYQKMYQMGYFKN